MSNDTNRPSSDQRPTSHPKQSQPDTNFYIKRVARALVSLSEHLPPEEVKAGKVKTKRPKR